MQTTMTRNDEGLRLFDKKEDALAVFEKGRRLAKGTTSEVGLVESYFANPFGAIQRREIHQDIARKTF
jgi:hypothetical protein